MREEVFVSANLLWYVLERAQIECIKNEHRVNHSRWKPRRSEEKKSRKCSNKVVRILSGKEIPPKNSPACRALRPTRTRTGVTGIKIPGANHYTIGPMCHLACCTYCACTLRVLWKGNPRRGTEIDPSAAEQPLDRGNWVVFN